MSDYVHLNGQIVPYDSAHIAAGDAGLLHGAGLFETMRARNRKVFRLRSHLERITRSAAALSIPMSLGETQLAEMIEDLLAANDLADARLRLTITRGDLHAATAEDPIPPVTLLLTSAEFLPYPAQLYEKGMTVVISSCKQNPESPITGHKTTSYLDRLLALREAQQIKAGEALWFTEQTNYLAEGSISNVFIVDKEGLLATPPLTMPEKTNQRLCLPGVTRQVVLELATSLNILPHERLLTINDLLAARELFLTNSIMGIMPVTAVEKHIISEGNPGPLTRQLREAYERHLLAETA
jgi:branched-subunit amino acid aminotransferase/4-amino-4-deoxychorismate lyase